MVFGEIRIVGPLFRSLPCDLVRSDAQFFSGHVGSDQRLAGPLKVVERVERLRHGGADDQHAMIAQDQQVVIADASPEPLALFAQSHAVEPVVDGDPLIEAHRVLVDRRHRGVAQGRQHGRVLRMDVQDAAGLRQIAMHGAVNGPGGRIGCVRPVHRRRIAGVE